MHSRKKLWLSARPLELAFYRCWMRLSPTGRGRAVEDLQGPFRRQWYVVDEQGVRRLLPDE